MAKQCGPIFLETTWDDLTFYKMDGAYYVRRKSSLTREKVLTHPDFEKTRFYANRLVVASKIASSIYSDLPKNWRQFWMYQSFTGEAFTRLEEGCTPQQTYDYLWTTYIAYWVLYQQATGIVLETGRTMRPKRYKTYKTRVKHRTENPACRRYLRLIGRNHWNSSYDNTADLIKAAEKKARSQRQKEWLEQQRIIGKWKAEERTWDKLIAQLSRSLVKQSDVSSPKTREPVYRKAGMLVV